MFEFELRIVPRLFPTVSKLMMVIYYLRASS